MAKTDIYDNNYGLLRVYTYYRVALGSLLLMLHTSDLITDLLGSIDKQLFLYTTLVYTILNIVTLLRLWISRLEPTTSQVVFFLIVDIFALNLLSYASGGIKSGIGYLLIITAATGAIFLRGQWAMFIAAFAAISALAETIISGITHGNKAADLFSAAALGILLFATAILFQYLTQRIRESTAEAQDQAHLAAKAIDISQQIIARMRTGVLVMDAEEKIQLINHAAGELLGLKHEMYRDISDIEHIPIVYRAYQQWRESPTTLQEPVHIAQSNNDVRINFAMLGEQPNASILVFVEDHRLLAQEAQKLKLGSLGQLTASIAHEIRNPLGAISHAAQLLAETPNRESSDERLLNIIINHSKRVNQIIENTLQLSRRSQGQAEVIDLRQWLPKFIADYEITHSIDPPIDIELVFISDNNEPILAKIDVNHLRQILTNLIENGLRYSFKNTGLHHLLLRASNIDNGEITSLQIQDDGVGISKEHLKHIFEPFYTTENTGSGLGLYVSRELCQLNQASLNYFYNDNEKSCFQINFAHAQQMF